MQKLEAENRYVNRTFYSVSCLTLSLSLLIDGIEIVAPFNAPIEQFLASQNGERPTPLSPPILQVNGMPDDRGGLQTVNGHSKVRPPLHCP